MTPTRSPTYSRSRSSVRGFRARRTRPDFWIPRGVDARICELPLPAHSRDFSKVDLDDYIHEWIGEDGLDPVLRSASTPEEHPAYDPAQADPSPSDPEHGALSPNTPGDTPSPSGVGSNSTLFDLDVTDVAPVSWGYRGKNPLGHHGDSENYTVAKRGMGLLHDFKYPASYNGLTYLLCADGERPDSNPSGDLDDGEVFTAWKTAKNNGHIPDDDPIPRRALQYVLHPNSFIYRTVNGRHRKKRPTIGNRTGIPQ